MTSLCRVFISVDKKDTFLKMIPVRTAQSQHPNVYKHYKFPLDGMLIDVIRYEPHTLSLRPFTEILFPTASLIFTAAKLFHQVI